jgi:pentatricopeptide repeat protein
MDSGIVGYKARHNLALVYCEAGDLESAEKEWRQVIEESPGFRAGWTGLVDCLGRQGKFSEARKVVERFRLSANDNCIDVLIAQIAEAEGNIMEARTALLNALEHNPNNVSALQSLCKLLFEHGPADAALAAQSKLNRILPGDGAVLHNLATLYLQIGLVAHAAKLYEKSIEVRPQSIPTILQLGHCLQSQSDRDGALRVYLNGLGRSPQDPELLVALERLHGSSAFVTEQS